MSARATYWWRLDLYEPEEMGSGRTHGLPFRRIQFRAPGYAYQSSGKQRDLIAQRLAKVGYRITGPLTRRATLQPRGEWQWRGSFWQAKQEPGEEITGRVSQSERPLAIGPGPDDPVRSVRGVEVIDWPRGRPAISATMHGTTRSKLEEE